MDGDSWRTEKEIVAGDSAKEIAKMIEDEVNTMFFEDEYSFKEEYPEDKMHHFTVRIVVMKKRRTIT